MTTSFFRLFRRVTGNHADLVRICLEGMPHQTRKILGKSDLSGKDLPDLPTIPSTCKHRLVYIDVATRLQEGQIRKIKRDFCISPKVYKTANRVTDLKEAVEVKLYVGSSVNRRRGHTRNREHEDISKSMLMPDRISIITQLEARCFVQRSPAWRMAKLLR